MRNTVFIDGYDRIDVKMLILTEINKCWQSIFHCLSLQMELYYEYFQCIFPLFYAETNSFSSGLSWTPQTQPLEMFLRDLRVKSRGRLLTSGEEPHPPRRFCFTLSMALVWSSQASLIHSVMILKPAAVDTFNSNTGGAEPGAAESGRSVFGQAFVSKLFTAADKPGRLGGRNENNDWNPRVFPELACRHERLITLQSSRYSGPDHTSGMNYLNAVCFHVWMRPKPHCNQRSAWNTDKLVSIPDAKRNIMRVTLRHRHDCGHVTHNGLLVQKTAACQRTRQ